MEISLLQFIRAAAADRPTAAHVRIARIALPTQTNEPSFAIYHRITSGCSIANGSCKIFTLVSPMMVWDGEWYSEWTNSMFITVTMVCHPFAMGNLIIANAIKWN